MTHFTIGIIVPDRIKNVDTYIARQMAPYFEHDEVEPYVCYSLEQAAADIAAAIHRLDQIIGRNEPMYDIEKCRAEIARLRLTTPQQRYEEQLRYHERFNDDGEPLSTYNPNSKWDWYVIGGRWDGWINDKKSTGESLAINTALTEQAASRGKIPHAIITPDRQWHEHGRMGWWGTMLTENDGWDLRAKQLFAMYPGQRLVIVDAHI